MSTRYLHRFFRPESIAVLGASERKLSLGGVVLRNLLAAGYPGQLMAVNPRGGERIHDIPRYANIAALPEPPELAVVCTAPRTIPTQIRALGKKGVKAALVLMGGLSKQRSTGALSTAIAVASNLLGTPLAGGKTLKEATSEAARPYGIRIMGPNSIGVLVPRHQLNASYAHLNVAPGHVAFVGQSGMLGLAMIDWAHGHELGFSHLLTLGDSLDVDIADVIDYLADDVHTQAILLHIERLTSGRRFLSAVCAASRNKLVLAIKSGRVPQSQEPIEPIAPGLVGEDAVYDAVLSRAGVLRLERSDELFNALEALTRVKRIGERLAIICNGVGPTMLAADLLIRSGGTLATLSKDTITQLSALLPSWWTHRNPIDINADATPKRYVKVLDTVLKDPAIDATLVIHIPTRIAPSLATARAVIACVQGAQQPILTSWMGHSRAQAGRNALEKAGIPSFNTPEQAVHTFMHMVNYHRNQIVLQQTPPPLPLEDTPDTTSVWALLGDIRRQGRDYLNDRETAMVLKAYAIPMIESRYVDSLADLGQAAAGMTPPYALKIVHTTHCHPFSGRQDHRYGIALDLHTVTDLENVAKQLTDQVQDHFPDTRILGYTLQRMQRGLHSLQLSMGITRDAIFGPLVVFGAGGHPRTVLTERCVALPPLNLALARTLVESSCIPDILAEHSSDPQQDLDRLCHLLIRLAQMAIDVAVIKGLEINPLLLNRQGIIALDAKIDLGEPVESAIHPYPEALRESLTLPHSGRRVELRPIRGEDEPAHAEFAGKLSPAAIRYRFFHQKSSISHQELAQLTQIDYAREMAFIASAENAHGEPETLGVVRGWTDPDNIITEVAVIVRDDQRGEGLGRLLMQKMIEYCRRRGILSIQGTVLPDNKSMLRLAERLDFSRHYSEQDDVIVITLALNEPIDDWQRERLAADYG